MWPNAGLPTTYWQLHLNQSPTTPYSIDEFQGGSFDPWGGPGFKNCEILVNYEFVRVFYKDIIASAAKIFNIYMVFGEFFYVAQPVPMCPELRFSSTP